MSEAAPSVQSAFITRYRADATLQGLIGADNPAIGGPTWNIFDVGGSGKTTEVFPYVYAHPITAALGGAFSMGTDAQDVFMQVDVFTAVLGFYQASALGARVYDLTHMPAGATPFTLTGPLKNWWTVCELRAELEEQTDVNVQHVVYRFKVCTHHT